MAEPDWATSYQSMGVGHRDGKMSRRVKAQPIAGMTSFECAYTAAANDYPRFERQMIRTMHDHDITAGAKQPHPEMLKHLPNPRQMARPGTGASVRSGRSVGSQGSRRSRASSVAVSSAGASIARSTVSRPPTGYFTQPLPHPFLYSTSAAQIGGGGRVAPEPVPGREVWMLGRGGGQQSSYDSCLVRKGHPA